MSNKKQLANQNSEVIEMEGINVLQTNIRNTQEFEEYVNRMITEAFTVPEGITLKDLTKLRDSARVAFLENKVKYVDAMSVLEDDKVPQAEKEIVYTKAEQFLERAKGFLRKYNASSAELKVLRSANKKVEVQPEEQK